LTWRYSIKINSKYLNIVKSSGWIVSEKLIRMSIGIAIGIWIARYLGPESFGILSYSLSVVSIFSVIATLGLDGILVRELVKCPTRANELLFTSVTLKIVASLTILLVTYLTLYIFVQDKQVSMLIMIISISTIFQSLNVFELFFQSIVEMKYVFFSNAISMLVSSCVKIFLLMNGGELVDFAWVAVLEIFIIFITVFIFFIWYAKSTLNNALRAKFNINIAKELLKDSWPLLFSGMVISLYMKIDQIMINGLLGSKDVGLYAAAVWLSEAIYFLPMAIVVSVYPLLIRSKEIGEKYYLEKLQILYDTLVWLAILISLIITFSSDFLITNLYGPSYSDASDVLKIHVWSSIFVFVGIAYSRFLMIENLKMKALYRTLLGLIINISFNFILIPLYGINGAAVATLLSQLGSNYLYDLFDKNLRYQFYMKIGSFNPRNLYKQIWSILK